MKNLRIAFVVVTGLVSMFAAASNASAAAFTFSVGGAGVLPANQDTTPVTSLAGKFSYGGGALLEARFNPHLGLEAGGLYLDRKWNQQAAGFDTGSEVESKSIYIPF